MSSENKKNLLYFEATSMRELFETMENWQNVNQKRLLSTNIQNDNGKFCCIALTNPTEVVIYEVGTNNYARVSKLGNLQVEVHR